MKPLAIMAGIACGLGVPIFLAGATIALLSLIDVYAQTLGYGQD